MRGRAQALDHYAVFQVRVDDFVNIVRIQKAVPHGLGVHHTHGARSAAVQAGGLVHAHMACAAQTRGLHGLFAVLGGLYGIVVAARCAAIGAFVRAKKDVPLVVRRGVGAGSHSPILSALVMALR